ncbi:hypothetical protein PV677_35905 [Streptomyces sp. DE06-01C]|uniref:hypothetical protein n=1 Tax=Streptomyces sp. DE06-01C TaxID=3028656 RepID=UPI0029C4EFBC|nr:hypothetical protein [Streptomyces sp. DE06-01C]MDX5526055.1 hypothetical protein [Streptomyces sp. DE06-01C]
MNTPTIAPTTYHWIATVRTRGDAKTSDGTITVTPGHDTHADVYGTVLDHLADKHGPDIAIVFFSLTPNQL